MSSHTKHKSIRAWALGSLGVGLLLVAISFGLNIQPKEVVANTQDNVTGYAWSSTTGWISMNCTNDGTCGTVDYGVRVDTNTGAFSGYAWSYNIGWIKFSPNSCGTGGPRGVSLNLQTGAISGWAEILSPGQATGGQAGGWTGCISMSGIAQNGQSYGVTVPVPAGGNASGYAWNGIDVGSDVTTGGDGIVDVGSPLDGVADIGAGWINFSGVEINLSQTPTAFVDLNDNPSFAGSLCGDDATLVWNYSNVITNAANGHDCDLLINGVHDQYIDVDNQTSVTYPINNITQFKLICHDANVTGNPDIWDSLTLSCVSPNANLPQCSNSATGTGPIDDDNDGEANELDASCHTDCNAQNIGTYDPAINDESRTCAGDILDGINGGSPIKIIET